MRLRLALIAGLLVSGSPIPALKAQPVPTAPATMASGWSRPMIEFPAGFNTTATRINIETRAVEVDCRDRGTRVLTCRWQVGPHLVAIGAAAEDRRSLEDVQVFLEASAGIDGTVSLLGAFTVLMHYFEPSVSQGERGAALAALFPRAAGAPLNSEVRLGATRFSLRQIPSVRAILTVRREG
jgi:hypothetical protein